MTPNDLRKMVAEATPGPWRVINYSYCPGHPWIDAACNFDKRQDGSDYYLSVSGRISQEDANLIAAAPTLALALVEAVEALDRIETLALLVAHDLTGRVETGKVAAVQQCADRARAAIAKLREALK